MGTQNDSPGVDLADEFRDFITRMAAPDHNFAIDSGSTHLRRCAAQKAAPG